MLNPTGIAFVLFHVTDVARARKFYGETLGLKVCMEFEPMPGRWWIEYDLGGPSALGVTNLELPGANVAPSPGLAIEVTNYDEALAALEQAGVKIQWGPNDYPMCRSFGFKDPDGNDIHLHARKQPA